MRRGVAENSGFHSLPGDSSRQSHNRQDGRVQCAVCGATTRPILISSCQDAGGWLHGLRHSSVRTSRIVSMLRAGKCFELARKPWLSNCLRGFPFQDENAGRRARETGTRDLLPYGGCVAGVMVHYLSTLRTELHLGSGKNGPKMQWESWNRTRQNT